MISSNAKIWIWLASALGFANPKIRRLYELYPDISDFYNGGAKEWRLSGIFNQRDLNKLEATQLNSADKILDRCMQLNYSVISIDDESFPACLRNIEAPPAVIYVSGHLPDIDNRLSIGIVGTRRATDYGITNSYKIGYALSKYGVTIVSGGALGVDCASHRGTLATDGVTICVLGCGINYNYLNENAMMRQAITKRGAVISEYPPDSAPRNFHFPARNRIISALSDGVLIIEAGIKSGSLITANYAGEQGKKVFALLGNNSPQNEGSNERIKEGTAIPITDFLDILNEFDGLYATNGDIDFNFISENDLNEVPTKGKSKKSAKSRNAKSNLNNCVLNIDELKNSVISKDISNKSKKKSDNNRSKSKTEEILDAEKSVAQKNSFKVQTEISEHQKSKSIAEPEKSDSTDTMIEKADNNDVRIKNKENLNLNTTVQAVYDYINCEPVHIDKIANDLNIPIFKVLVALTTLEMKGLVTALQGRRYILK
ncbi:MAG: DNA-processing protein DprA [Ruminococcus sp.]|nr:DNA-processing protein DprA [Ruminococcus sp.]